MSELTKRLREQLTMSKFTNRAYLYARMDDDRRVAADRIEALEECLRELAAMTAAQAEDEGLWFNAMHASEGYLQQELRKLHAAIENKARALLESR